MRNKDHGAAGRTGQIRNKDWGAAGGCEKFTKASGTDETASGREVEFTIKGLASPLKVKISLFNA